LGAESREALPSTEIKPIDSQVKLKVQLALPRGWKINPLAPMAYELTAKGAKGPLEAKGLGKKKLDKPAAEFPIALPVAGEGQDEIHVKVNYYYCQEADDGVCKVGSVTFVVPLEITSKATATTATLRHVIAE
jgi:hypothetical protein